MDNLYLIPIEEELLKPVKYYYEQSGKDIRKLLVLQFSKQLKVDDKEIENVNKIISLIHNASLVIDDIQDNSDIRRNKECAHKIYGIPLTLNAGYLTIFKVLFNINSNVLSETVKNKIIENIYYAHIGQGMDIYYTTNKIVPSMDDYYTMMKFKTGMEFLTILDLISEKGIPIEHYKEFMIDFSYFFQIRDDYINLTDPLYWKEKGFCQDIDEKKISFLVVYYINNKLLNYDKLLKLLEKGSIEKIIYLFHDNGLFDIVYEILDSLKNKINGVLELNNIFILLPFNKFDLDQFLSFKVT